MKTPKSEHEIIMEDILKKSENILETSLITFEDANKIINQGYKLLYIVKELRKSRDNWREKFTKLTKMEKVKLIERERIIRIIKSHIESTYPINCKSIIEEILKMEKPKCEICGKEMENAIDSKTGKLSKYLWRTTCGHNSNLVLARG